MALPSWPTSPICCPAARTPRPGRSTRSHVGVPGRQPPRERSRPAPATVPPTTGRSGCRTVPAVRGEHRGAAGHREVGAGVPARPATTRWRRSCAGRRTRSPAAAGTSRSRPAVSAAQSTAGADDARCRARRAAVGPAARRRRTPRGTPSVCTACAATVTGSDCQPGTSARARRRTARPRSRGPSARPWHPTTATAAGRSPRLPWSVPTASCGSPSDRPIRAGPAARSPPWPSLA